MQPAKEATLEPVPGREAFDARGADARRTQAALLLSVGTAVAGDIGALPPIEQLRIPHPESMTHPDPIPLATAARKLSVDTREYARGFTATIDDDEPARLTHELYDAPDPPTAAALVEAGLHSPSRLVRTAAASAALDTTGPRPDVIAQLTTSAAARDPEVRDIARTALARLDREHAELARYTVQRRPIAERSEESSTAVLSHGTFAANSRWWRPGGDFYDYLDGLTPPLHMHDESYRWSGAYSAAQRDLAADDLIAWVDAQQLDTPDYFAHSHGATVGNLATQKGARFDRLVLLACPVHQPWLPDLSRVRRLIDVRVNLDLVIIADRGRQRLPAAVRADSRVTEVRNGWFSHGAPHDPDYWDDHDIPSVL